MRIYTKINIVFLSVLLLLTAVSPCMADDTSPVITQSYSADWKFHAEGADSFWAAIEYNDSEWIETPSTQSLAQQGIDVIHNCGWFRKSITFSDSLRQSIENKGAIILHLGKFGWCDEVYVNGTLIGKTGSFPPEFIGVDTERNYLVLAENLNVNGANVIAIKFSQGWLKGGFLGGTTLSVSSATTDQKITFEMKVDAENYIFSPSNKKEVSMTLNIANLNKWPVDVVVSQSLTTDMRQTVWNDSAQLNIGGGIVSKRDIKVADLEPGFYTYCLELKRGGKAIGSKKFNIGYAPEAIESPMDSKSDLRRFWDESLAELAKVAPNYELKHLADKSNNDYDLYLVEMHSFENELIRGYYAKPKREGKFPVIVEYMGYASKPYMPYMYWDGYAYFILSTRGQGLNEETNRFGKWIASGLETKETYYYRGAFLDVVRALDFVCSRPEIDADRIGVRGGSQGGAFTFAAAALDSRVKVAAPTIPFLSDYRDYFTIAPWPKMDIDEYMSQHPEANWEQVYDVLTYFDIKNLAQWITCPLLMGIGVQDQVCPPHINFAAYNQVRSEKKWLAFPNHYHSVGKDYFDTMNKLFREKLNPVP